MNTPLMKKLVAVVVALLAVLGGTVLVIDTDGPGPRPAHTVTIPSHLPGPLTAAVDSGDADRLPDTTVTAPAVVVAQAKTGEVGEDLRAENPTAGNVAAQDQAAHDDQLPLVGADAAPSQRGCLSRFVVNYSSRRGVAPRLLELHETVSRNVPGWADVNAIGVQFNQPRSQASSTYTLDREAHCLYLVRESDKPWTQAAANPWSISFEIINTATPSDRNLIDGPGRKLLLGILNDASKRWDIPLRSARTRSCTPLRAGISDHSELGPCGGGHVDTAPWRGGSRPGQVPRGAVRALVVDARRLCEKRYRAAHKPTPARCKA
ncbi:hypothetical protein DSM104299_03221 [Baekduia alba]|uniref:hypothetical protein n=1 Tax=Baekduia alba TaxID=2997333 RepID=UPI002340E281|nr:hypothetical protein [Baekduia alba]WCB94484.1 hypothetical protein DSM104299_03221 [Baekduia alba]